MSGYYNNTLAAERLEECYRLAPPRVREYLEAEVRHVLARIDERDSVLELGCGYGRALEPLSKKAAHVVGIDTSAASLDLARRRLGHLSHLKVMEMDAVAMSFPNGTFDVVVCIQNGISAFAEDRPKLVQESVRVANPGGTVLFSSYAEAFWADRLEWFQRQADAGLLGAIDRQNTGDGVIVCHDGFRATTMSPEAFRALAASLGLDASIEEVNGSSLFCEIHVRSSGR